MEADDVMATLARRAELEGLDVVLVTGDKDLVQLVSDRVKILAPLRRGEEYAWIDRQAVLERWGVPPEHLVDVLALLGDTIDNVPGVPGIGEKTADELLRAFGSLEGIYAALDQVKKPSIRKTLETHREQAFLSRELVTVRTDLDVGVDWKDLRVQPIRRDAFRDLVTRYELRGAGAAPGEIADTEARAEAVATEPVATAAPSRAAARAAPALDTTTQGSLDLWIEAPSVVSGDDPAAVEAQVRAVLATAGRGSLCSRSSRATHRAARGWSGSRSRRARQFSLRATRPRRRWQPRGRSGPRVARLGARRFLPAQARRRPEARRASARRPGRKPRARGRSAVVRCASAVVPVRSRA